MLCPGEVISKEVLGILALLIAAGELCLSPALVPAFHGQPDLKLVS